MSKTSEDFKKEAERRSAVAAITDALRHGKLVRVPDTDYMMKPREYRAFKRELAATGYTITDGGRCDARMCLPDGRSQVSLLRITPAVIVAGYDGAETAGAAPASRAENARAETAPVAAPVTRTLQPA